MNRINAICLIAGTRGTGKTTAVKRWIKEQTKKVLIVDTFSNPAWKEFPSLDPELLKRWNSGIYRFYDSDTNKVMAAIEKSVYNALLVFEDATKYVGSKLSEDVKKFALDSKQKNLDVIFIFHSLSDIPRDLVRISDTITLFKTVEESSNPNLKNKYRPNILELMDMVNSSDNKYECQTIVIGS